MNNDFDDISNKDDFVNTQINMQRDVGLAQHHRMSGTSSATRIGSTQQGPGLTEPPVQGFGRQREGISA